MLQKKMKRIRTLEKKGEKNEKAIEIVMNKNRGKQIFVEISKSWSTLQSIFVFSFLNNFVIIIQE